MENTKKEKAKKVCKRVAIGCAVGATAYFGWVKLVEATVPYSYRGALSDIWDVWFPTPPGSISDNIQKGLTIIEAKLGIPHIGRMVNGEWI